MLGLCTIGSRGANEAILADSVGSVHLGGEEVVYRITNSPRVHVSSMHKLGRHVVGKLSYAKK